MNFFLALWVDRSVDVLYTVKKKKNVKFMVEIWQLWLPEIHCKKTNKQKKTNKPSVSSFTDSLYVLQLHTQAQNTTIRVTRDT